MSCLRLLMLLLICIEASCVRADEQAVRCKVRNGSTPVVDATIEVVLSVLKSESNPDNYTVIEETFFESDERGDFDIVLPDLDLSNLRIAMTVLRKGFVPYHSKHYELDEFLHPRFDGRTIQLTKLFRWRAQILTSDGEAAGSAKVRVAPTQKYEGRFSLKLPQESESFTADKQGFVEVTSTRNANLRVSRNGEAPLLIAGFDAEAASKQTTTHLQFTHGTSLKGKAKTANGNPLPLAAIIAEETSFRYRMPLAVAVVSDEQGNYELPPLPDGVYRVAVIGCVSGVTEEKQTVDSLRGQARPINALFFPRRIRLEARPDPQQLDLQASELNDVTLKVCWDDARDGSASIRLNGFVADNWWHSEPQLTDSNGELKFFAPTSLKDAFFDTGVVQVRNSDGKLELADFVSVGKQASLVDVTFPSIVNLTARLVLPDDIAVDIVAFYAREGRRRGYSGKQPIYLTGSVAKTKDSTLEYSARAIVGEEIIFQVRSRSDATKVMRTERFTLTEPGIHEVNLDLTQPN